MKNLTANSILAGVHDSRGISRLSVRKDRTPRRCVWWHRQMGWRSWRWLHSCGSTLPTVWRRFASNPPPAWKSPLTGSSRKPPPMSWRGGSPRPPAIPPGPADIGRKGGSSPRDSQHRGGSSLESPDTCAAARPGSWGAAVEVASRRCGSSTGCVTSKSTSTAEWYGCLRGGSDSAHRGDDMSPCLRTGADARSTHPWSPQVAECLPTGTASLGSQSVAGPIVPATTIEFS